MVKPRRILSSVLLGLSLVVVIALGACAATSTASSTSAASAPAASSVSVATITAQVQTVVTKGCAFSTPVLIDLTTPGLPTALTGVALTNAQKAQKDFGAVCSQNFTTANLTELVDYGLPSLNAAIQASALSQTVKDDAAFAVPAMQLGLAAFSAAAAVPAVPPAAASSAAAASAPAAASASQ